MVVIKSKDLQFFFANPQQYEKHIVEDKHAERTANGGIKFVSDGKRDIQKEIESQACNAGLQNIIRLQTLRYGTLENAIARNKEKQVFADVSKVPESVGEQAEMVKEATDNLQALADKYGVTVEQLLALKSSEDFQNLVTPKQNENAHDEGGNE